jgi:DNA-binding MarR family transcriptional regulator
MDATAQRLHDLFMELVRAIMTVQQAAPGEPVTLSQTFALHELDTDTPMSQRDLAERLRLEKSSVSRLAAEMERRGLLVRERDPANRRFYRLRLTDLGRACHTSIGTAFHEQFAGIVEGMTAAERAALVAGLTAFVREMRRPRDARAPVPTRPRHRQ